MQVTDPAVYSLYAPFCTGRCSRDADWNMTRMMDFDASISQSQNDGNITVKNEASHRVRSSHTISNESRETRSGNCYLANTDPSEDRSQERRQHHRRKLFHTLHTSLLHLKQITRAKTNHHSRRPNHDPKERRTEPELRVPNLNEWEIALPTRTRHHHPKSNIVNNNCECSSSLGNQNPWDKQAYCRLWLEDPSHRLIGHCPIELTPNIAVEQSDQDSAVELDVSPNYGNDQSCQIGCHESASEHSFPFNSSDSSALSHPSDVDCIEQEDAIRPTSSDPYPHQVSRRPEWRSPSGRTHNPAMTTVPTTTSMTNAMTFSWENYHDYYKFQVAGLPCLISPSLDDPSPMECSPGLLNARFQNLSLKHRCSRRSTTGVVPYMTSVFPHSNVIPPPNHNPFAKK